MNIVQVCPYDIDRPGGVQTHIRSLASYLRSRGHDVRIIAPGPAPAEPSDGVTYVGTRKMVSFAGTRFEVSWCTASELRTAVHRLGDWPAEIVHYHTMWTPFLAMKLFGALAVPSVATFHDTPPDSVSGNLLRRVFRFYSRYLLSRLNGAIAVSHAPMAHLNPGATGIRPQIVPPVIDLSFFGELEARKSESDTTINVLYFGRLEPRKGVDVLLKAWSLICAENAGDLTLNLVIAGSGPLEDAVVEAVEASGSRNMIHTPAPGQRELGLLMEEADIMVAPAPYGESFGLVLVEAMAAGLPVIAADNRGFSSVLTGKLAAGLVRKGDATSLAQKITELSNDKTLREELSKAGRLHAASFDVSNQAGKFEDIYAAAITHYHSLHRAGGAEVGNAGA